MYVRGSCTVMGRAYADKVKSRSGDGKRASTPRRGSGKGSKKEERPPFPLAPFVVMGVILVLIVAGLVMYAIDQNGDESGTTTEGNDDNGGGGAPQSSGDGPGSILLDSVDDGGQIFLDQYKGKVVVIDMFATWCGPCRTQMGELSDLSSRFSPSDLVILSVDADLSENMDQVRELRTQVGASWTFAMSNSDFNSVFPASSIPTMFILDREGNVVEKHVGVTSADVLESEIDSHL